jgi:hypothetical protein
MGQKEVVDVPEKNLAEEPDAQNGNVRTYVYPGRRISASSSSSALSSRLFYRQTFRNEASPRLSSWSFREPTDNQHKSRRVL